MRRAGVVLSGIAMAMVVVACASAGHTWQDEFTARLEGASVSQPDGCEAVQEAAEAETGGGK